MIFTTGNLGVAVCKHCGTVSDAFLFSGPAPKDKMHWFCTECYHYTDIDYCTVQDIKDALLKID